jgi:BirA family biotin operon repressor/biotin-[acetyl-CoA-carboxylase] ligase
MGSDVEVDPSDLVILTALREGDGGYVSGSHLAELLSISRAAVGKRINALRENGWEIEALPRLGYQLISEPDSLHPLVVEGLLSTERVGRSYRYLPEVTSTNDELRTLAEQGGAEGSVVVADKQTAGKGRLGRPWRSPAGQNLYLSLLVCPPCAPSEMPPVSLAAAVGIARGIEPFLGEPPTVKWPNDILFDGRKLCGILTEMSADMDRVRYVIVGAGINVNQTRFTGDLAKIATSVRQETGERVSRAAVLGSVLASLEHWLDKLLFGDMAQRDEVLAEWMALAPWVGSSVTVKAFDRELSGIATGIDTTGALLIDGDDGLEHRLLSGDVTLTRHH